eukprot:4980801-Karenia_brevis.AAC.1
MNSVAASALTNASVIQDLGLPTHLPLVVELGVNQYTRPVWRAWRPKHFPTHVLGLLSRAP